MGNDLESANLLLSDVMLSPFWCSIFLCESDLFMKVSVLALACILGKFLGMYAYKLFVEATCIWCVLFHVQINVWAFIMKPEEVGTDHD